jgi:general secretion pathway protein H
MTWLSKAGIPIGVPSPVVVGEGRPSTDFHAPAPQVVDGRPSPTTTSEGLTTTSEGTCRPPLTPVGGIPLDRGFTLIEMLVVIAILAAASAILVARGPARSPGLEARAAASDLAQTLRLGRSRAIAADRPVSVVLDLATHALTLDRAPRPALPGSVGLAAVMADGSVVRQQAVFVFAPDGSASGGQVLLGVGGRRLVVAVDWLTGRVGVDAR